MAVSKGCFVLAPMILIEHVMKDRILIAEAIGVLD
jgi:hypothetical protein